MARAIIAVLDSLGVGETDDAPNYGDEGANTFGHIVEACANGKADRAGTRGGPLHIPNLLQLGFGLAAKESGRFALPLEDPKDATGLYGFAAERSFGKDTPSGHWEMAGLPVEFDWVFFPRETPCFPDALIDALIDQADLPGVLGNKHASGTVIIEELGAEHMKTGKPIVYTSADSVFQIAAHEESFGLDRLYDLCAIARKLVDEYNVGRVIARPFIGEAGGFARTGNRRDLATPPHAPTLLDIHSAAGGEVISIGKIADIFAHSGITRNVKAHGNDAIFDAMLQETRTAPENAIIFANFVDFDSLYGHRRDVVGYATALESFDQRLPELSDLLRPEDVVFLTADHGCDPTWPGSDHTRENIPMIAFGPQLQGRNIGKRDTFADLGQSVAAHLKLDPLDTGNNFL